jgi:sulfofructose kinase
LELGFHINKKLGNHYVHFKNIFIMSFISNKKVSRSVLQKREVAMDSVPEVVGIGHCAMDFLGIIPYYPPLDARVCLEKLYRQGGGEAATAMVTLARLGVPVAFVGKVGDDEIGSVIRDELNQENVNASQLVIQPGGQSLWAFGAVDKKSGKRTLFWHKNLTPLLPSDLDYDFIQSARILHCDQHEPQASLVAAEFFKKAGKTVVLDIDDFNPQLEKILCLDDIVVGSEVFAHLFDQKNDYLNAS